MRFAAFLGTKDEADILPLAIEQLRHVGVELIVVIDVGSSDGTMAYLAEAERAGDVWVFHDDRAERPEALTRAAKSALARGIEAEWILFLDSDEQVLPLHGSLHDLADLDDYDILAIPRYNAVLTADGAHLPADGGPLTPERYDEVFVYAQPIPDFYYHMQRHPETPWIRGVLEPKTLLRTEAVETLHFGDHDVEAAAGRPWRRAVARDLLLVHLPFRDLERFEVRCANVLAEVDAAPEIYSGWTAWQWQRFARMAREGRISEEYGRQVTDADEVATLRSQRIVRSVKEIYAQPIIAAQSEEEWLAMAARAEPWLTATDQVGRREQIQPGGKLEQVSRTGRYPSVLLPPDHVVRFYGPWLAGHEAQAREASLLHRLETEPALETPRVVAIGDLAPDLRYVVISRVPGVALRDIRYQVDSIERLEVAAWLGAFMGRLHALESSPAERESGWHDFVEFARGGYGRIATNATGLGASAALIERISAWLPSLDELMGRPEGAVIGHGALGASSLMGQPAEPSFRATGVVDWSRSFVGHPMADFGTIWWQILACDPAALERFLDASEMHRQTPDLSRHALAWVLMAASGARPVLADISAIDEPQELAERWFGELA